MMECKVTRPMEATMTNHLETHKVEVQQEEYMGKMMIQLKEVLTVMESIPEVVEKSSRCILYQTHMEVSKY